MADDEREAEASALTGREAAELLGVERATLCAYASRGRGGFNPD